MRFAGLFPRFGELVNWQDEENVEGALRMERNIVIGIDGGGTHTRVLAVDLSGRTLAYSQTGSANPHKDVNAKRHVRAAIAEVLAMADRNEDDIVSLVAGLAGMDEEDDQVWADDFIDLAGLKGKKKAVSDAWIAQVGALGGIPGIVAISGTGSIVFGINEDGEQLRNYHFRQYAYSTARHLSYETVHRIIAGEYASEDRFLVSQVLEYWAVPNTEKLGQSASASFMEDRRECDRKFAGMGRIVTDAAAAGSPLAADVCDAAVRQLATAVRLVGSRFRSDRIHVSFIGSVARSRYMKRRLEGELAKETMQPKTYVVQEPLYAPVAGAVLMAFRQAGITVTDQIRRNLELSPYCTA
jgi:glucosamine kinase